MHSLFSPLTFNNGKTLKNRFMLAPLTNQQSFVDGTLSDDEYHWLTKRAEGGFGLTMTCASHVQAVGQGFPGQLGIFSDEHLPGLTRLAAGIKQHDSLAVVQLHHAGNRTPADLIADTPVCPSDDPESGARALSNDEVHQLIEDFIQGAIRAEQAGFDGVELHGAHGYIICQFLSPTINQRTDEFGGSTENRARLLHRIIDGIRERCQPGFILGVRLSPERFGLAFNEMQQLAETLMTSNQIDYLDMSLWDSFKVPEETDYQDKSLLDWFAALPRGNTKLFVAGGIKSGADVQQAMAAGIDGVIIGRSAIIHHDFPRQIQANADFEPLAIPVSRDHLTNEGVTGKFLDYLTTRFDMVKD